MEVGTNVTNERTFSNIIVILILLMLFCVPYGFAQQQQIPSDQPCTAEVKPIAKKKKSNARRARSEAPGEKGHADQPVGICTAPSKGAELEDGKKGKARRAKPKPPQAKRAKG